MKFPKVYSMAVAAVVGALVAAPAYAATAFFTGRQEMVQTVTYQQAWRCEYNYNGQMIYEIFQTSCPSSIEVQ
jgi:hypothetical protein